MQGFRHEAALQDYYHSDYVFTTFHAYETVVNISSNLPSCEQQVNEIGTPTKTRTFIPPWRVRDTVDWSPNRARFRNNRKKQQHDKRKEEGPIAWTLPSAT